MPIFSVINSSQYLSKQFHVEKDGYKQTVHKLPGGVLSTGELFVGEKSLSDLGEMLNTLGPTQAIIHGIPVLSREMGDSFLVGSRNSIQRMPECSITRTKENFHYADNCLSMLDVDPDVQCPHGMLSTSHLIRHLATIDPQWKNVEYMVRQSVSSGIKHNGKLLSRKTQGYHLYFECSNGAMLPEYMEALFKLDVLKRGWVKLSQVGSTLIRGSFDSSVYDACRLDFAGTPVLAHESLSRDEPKITYKAGLPLDCTQMPNVDEKAYRTKIKDLKGDNSTKRNVKTVKAHYADELVKSRGMSKEQAGQYIKAIAKGIITEAVSIRFDDGTEVSAVELMSQHEKYDGLTCYDPVELDAGPNRAKFYWNDGTPVVHSMLHGGRNYYFQITLLETKHLELSTAPISQADFEDAMIARINSWKDSSFVVGSKMKKAFRTLGGLFNTCVEWNRDGKSPKRIVVPASTGVGKSVSSTLYLAKLATEHNGTGLLVVRRVEEAIEKVEEINFLSGNDDTARCYYSVAGKHKDTPERVDFQELENYPVIVITHVMFSIMAERLNPDAVKCYKGDPRELIIIDEAITFRSTVSVHLTDILDWLNYVNDGRACFWATTEYFKVLKKQAMDVPSTADVFFLKSFEEAIRFLHECVEVLKEEDCRLRPGHGTKTKKKRQALYTSFINTLNKFILINKYSGYGSKHMGSFRMAQTADLTNRFGSCVILDALADDDAIYQCHNANRDDIIMTEFIRVRSYSNVNLHVCTDSMRKQSRLHLTGPKTKPIPPSRRNKIIDEYVRDIREVAGKDKMLVVVPLPMLNAFRNRCPNSNISFTNWGKHAGTNLYREFPKCMLIGYHRKDINFATDELAGATGNGKILDYQPTTLGQGINADRTKIINTSAAVDAVQAIARVRLRVPVDADGNCAPSDIYFFDDESKTAKVILEIITNQFPGINVKPWLPSTCNTKSKMENIDQAQLIKSTLDIVSQEPGALFTSRMIAASIGCATKDVANVRKTKAFSKQMNNVGVERQKVKKKGSSKVAVYLTYPQPEEGVNAPLNSKANNAHVDAVSSWIRDGQQK